MRAVDYSSGDFRLVGNRGNPLNRLVPEVGIEPTRGVNPTGF